MEIFKKEKEKEAFLPQEGKVFLLLRKSFSYYENFHASYIYMSVS